MKTWVVRFLSLLVFNILVLLVIGWLTPARVGWSALWAGVVLTAATIWVKPVVHAWFTKAAAKSASQRTRAGEKLIEFAIVYVVALVLWVLVILLSGVNVGGFFWGYVLPPLILLIGWAVYAAIDDRVEGHAGALYDKATGSVKGSTDAAAPRVDSPQATAARAELDDGLTAEQRKMLDELG
ncbi:MAG TPA: hypothetical protein VNT50_01605 [Microbacterium sp.]|uniref:hypothetical protein n=1 Tax=Microbacterium sp. TaxID=51671 RepID=UPI002CC66E1A|nr:hypothetical protein [Microbacterium sp.]HWI30165.1 hypothetical protein [Microbacterium sp.]